MSYVVIQLDKVRNVIKGIYFHKAFRNRLKADSYCEEVKDRLKQEQKSLNDAESVAFVQEVSDGQD